MTQRRRLGWVVLTVVVALVAAGAVWALWPRGTELSRAAALLPADTVRVTWTDWAGVREELEAEPGTRDLDATLRRAADLDLSGVSPTASVARPLADTLGWGPADAEWEILGQGLDGMVLLVKLPEDADVDAIADRYASAGFTAPDEGRTDGGVWTGGPDVVARLDGLGEPVLQHAALLEDERLLISSDQAASVERAVPVARGDEEGLDLDRLAEPAGDALAAVAWATDRVCMDLSMADAGDGAQAQADRIIEDAGGVGPLDGYLVALRADRSLTAVLGYEDAERAERDRDSRAALAGMEDPAQGMAYPELFRLTDVRTEGDTVVLDLVDGSRDGYPLTNVTQGSVLLAAC